MYLPKMFGHVNSLPYRSQNVNNHTTEDIQEMQQSWSTAVLWHQKKTDEEPNVTYKTDVQTKKKYNKSVLPPDDVLKTVNGKQCRPRSDAAFYSADLDLRYFVRFLLLFFFSPST